MSKEIRFVIPEAAVPQPRHRTRSFIAGVLGRFKGGASRCPKCGIGLNIQSRQYVPERHKIHAWREAVMHFYRFARNGQEKLQGPISARIVCVLPRPASMNRKKDPDGRIFDDRDSSPLSGDADNLAKGILDALTGHAFERDGQVAVLEVVRVIQAKQDDPPSTSIHLRELSPELTPDANDFTPAQNILDEMFQRS